MCKQVAAAARFHPGDPVGRHLALDKNTSALAPEVEVVRFGQVHHVIAAELDVLEPHILLRNHAANSSNCSVWGASRLRRSARSVSSTGRQSTVQMKGRTLVIDHCETSQYTVNDFCLKDVI